MLALEKGAAPMNWGVLMKSIPRLAVLASAVVLLAHLPRAEAQHTTLRIAGNFATEHSSSKTMETFKSELGRLSKGTLAAELFPGMQLGGAQENVQAVRAGTIFATWIGVAFVSRLVPEVEAVSLPFVFKGREEAMRVIDGPAGDLIQEKLAAKGFLALGWMELGSRHVTNSKRPLKSLDDFKGLKVRMQPNETHLATFRALGANPVALDIKELYSALQQGVVDGQENPYPVIHANRYFEVQKYLSDTGHFFDFIILIANKRAFDAMSAEQKGAVREAAKAAVVQQRKMAADAEAATFAELKAKGMQFDSLSDETRAALRKASAGVIDAVKTRVGADLVEKVMAEAAKR
jgi:tripartite ATP-independent transporter DctP family solute receptor